MKYEIVGRRFEGGPLMRIDTYPNERIARRCETMVRSHGWHDTVIRPVVQSQQPTRKNDDTDRRKRLRVTRRGKVLASRAGGINPKQEEDNRT